MAAPNMCEPNSATRDHIIPKSRGGTNQEQNIRLICRACNIAKGNRMPTTEEVNSVKIPPNPNIEQDWNWFLTERKRLEVRVTTIENRIEEVESVKDIDHTIDDDHSLFLGRVPTTAEEMTSSQQGSGLVSSSFEEELREQVGNALGIISGVILDTVVTVATELHNEKVSALLSQIATQTKQAKSCLDALTHSIGGTLVTIQSLHMVMTDSEGRQSSDVTC